MAAVLNEGHDDASKHWLLQPQGESSDGNAKLLRRDGAGLWFYAGTYGKSAERIEVRGAWPRTVTGQEDAPYHRPGISVGKDRDPAGIARDIARRFLPEYLPEYARRVESCAVYNARVSAARGMCAALSTLVDGKISDPSDSECTVTWYGALSDAPWGHVKTHDAECFNVDIKGLDLEAAREVLEAVVRCRARKVVEAIDVDAIARDIEVLA